jgi:hypothetical protein
MKKAILSLNFHIFNSPNLNFQKRSDPVQTMPNSGVRYKGLSSIELCRSEFLQNRICNSGYIVGPSLTRHKKDFSFLRNYIILNQNKITDICVWFIPYLRTRLTI